MSVASQSTWTGLSPRVRGSRGLARARNGTVGSIPACAGEPREKPTPRTSKRVYPRVCGGAALAVSLVRALRGLSPRVRGSPPNLPPRSARPGSIPACAGEPPGLPVSMRIGLVYPRVCGGASTVAVIRDPSSGLSPRVRGSHDGGGPIAPSTGSIPACAGEPRSDARGVREHRVYPRVCGGASDSTSTLTSIEGLSPRVRGSPARERDSWSSEGSIPACAGEPDRAPDRSHMPRVYPRVCGGAQRRQRSLTRTLGLSPRVRGSPPSLQRHIIVHGSIPACAGGAARVLGLRLDVSGLSPRVRGSHLYPRHAGHSTGSIPACAGEPRSPNRRRAPCGVYPRVCGGAAPTALFAISDLGLSPRVRGSPPENARRHRRLGSIPACAGEPPRRAWRALS